MESITTQVSMTTTMMEYGIEVPSGPVSAGAGSKSVIQSSRTRSLNIPRFDDPEHENWVLERQVAAKMAWYESFVGPVRNPIYRKILLEKFETEVSEQEDDPNEYKLVWEGLPEEPEAEKPKKKSVSWHPDGPYKEKDGEVIEGPVWSQLTFEKEAGEDKEVFVNPERSV